MPRAFAAAFLSGACLLAGGCSREVNRQQVREFIDKADDAARKRFASAICESVDVTLAADDEDHSGTCYSLSTVLVANGVFGNTLLTWSAPDPDNESRWTWKPPRNFPPSGIGYQYPPPKK